MSTHAAQSGLGRVAHQRSPEIVQRVADASSYQLYPDSAGMKESMTCSGDQSRTSPAVIAARLQSVPVSVRSAVIASEIADLKSCAVWHVPSIAAINHTYFHSAIPTLLLTGKYDPKTPPSLAQALAPKLGHAYVIVMPTLSHVVVGYGTCPDSIASNFLTNPNRKPVAGCVASLTMPWL
jgi:pimeloyl-ACP methyl ester carboxylesterase